MDSQPDGEIIWFEKNRLGKYVAVSEEFARLSGQDSPLHCIDKTDSDLIWRGNGNICHIADQRIFSGEPSCKSQEWVLTLDGWNEYIELKTAIHRKRAICSGSMCNTGSFAAPLINQFTADRRIYLPQICQYLDWQELMVLRHLIYARSVAEVAEMIGRSRSTVHNKIDQVRKKFCATSNPELAQLLNRSGVAALIDVIESHGIGDLSEAAGGGTIVPPLNLRNVQLETDVVIALSGLKAWTIKIINDPAPIPINYSMPRMRWWPYLNHCRCGNVFRFCRWRLSEWL